MEFRHRDYALEREAHMIFASAADHHPLLTSSESYTSKEVMIVKENGDADDPLRMELSDSSFVNSDDSVTILNTDRVPSNDWNSFKRFLMQKFPVSKMISVSSHSNSIIKGVKSNITENYFRDDVEKEENNAIAREDYISKLDNLKDEINRAWLGEDRAEALKLAIKVAKLLMDTSSLQFYPTLFILATEIMDKLGEMVWERILHKAEFPDKGTIYESLSDDFRAKHINADAKEICYYWFCKIASIRDLLPRIYLELAILPCWRFLNDQPMQNVERLIRMARGIADPVASAYCRLYLVHCSKKLPLLNSNRDLLAICINDINLVLAQFLNKTVKSSIPFSERNQLLVSLVDPIIEYTMKRIFENSTESEADQILKEIGLKNMPDQRGVTQCLSVVLHHLLKELPCSTIQMNAMEILRLVQFTDDGSFDLCQNFKVLGLRISESKNHFERINIYLNEGLEMIEKFEELDSYMEALYVFLDLILQHGKDQKLVVIVEGLLNRVVAGDKIVHSESEKLQCILLTLLTHMKTLDRVCALVPFFELFNRLHDDHQATVGIHFLEIASRDNLVLESKKLILTFEFARRLCNNSKFSNMKCNYHKKLLPWISRILYMVRCETNFELHLKFLIDCREVFGNFNEIKEILVHSCNHLAVKASANSENNHAFIKSCVAFNEVTIPSIYGSIKQLHLYIETAEVSLLCGLSGVVGGLISSAICFLETPDSTDDGSPNVVSSLSSQMETNLLFSGLLKLCSLVIIVPGDIVKKFHKAILSIVESSTQINMEMKIKLLCGLLRLLAALSQNSLPYRPSTSNFMCNDFLFYGDATYVNDLASLSSNVLEVLMQHIERITSKNSRGIMALESCNCIISSFKANETMVRTCEQFISIATASLGSKDKFLLFTIKSLSVC